MALVTVHSELRRNRDFAWRRPLQGRRGEGGGAPKQGGQAWGKDLSNENRCQGVHLNSPTGCLALPSLSGAPLFPPGRRAHWRAGWCARSLRLGPDESSTSWRKAGTQGLTPKSRNCQDRDPPTQNSNLYTYLEKPALPLGKPLWGAGRGARGAGLLERGSFQLAAVRTGPARSRGLRTEVRRRGLV